MYLHLRLDDLTSETGDKLVGRLRKPKENEKFPAMLFLTHVNGEPTQSVAKRLILKI